MSKPVTLIFDLDGTLVETAPDLCAAMNAVLSSEGRGRVPLEEVRLMVGQGARALIRKGMASTGTPASEEDVERLFPVFMDYYIDHIADTSHPYPDVASTLQALEDQGYLLSICTNKPEGATHLLLDRMNLSHLFVSIIGADTTRTRKPDPGPLIEAARRAGGEMSRAVMIGDSQTDVSAARNAAIPVIGVSYGYTEIPITELNPDVIIDRFSELPEGLEKLSASL